MRRGHTVEGGRRGQEAADGGRPSKVAHPSSIGCRWRTPNASDAGSLHLTTCHGHDLGIRYSDPAAPDQRLASGRREAPS